MVSELTPSAQNYVRIIWSLTEWDDAPATVSAVAERAGVTMSTVSEAVRRLADANLVDHTPYGGLTLTTKGRSHALTMVRRHRLIETMLVEMFGYTWDEVHDEAEHLEHSVSDQFIERVDELLGRPDRDPHGDPIPRSDGTVPTSSAMRLTDAEAGTTVAVERISDRDADLLRYLKGNDIAIGSKLRVSPGAPFSDSIEVAPERGRPIQLGRAATDAIWIQA